jgi:chromosome partitioning protein
LDLNEVQSENCLLVLISKGMATVAKIVTFANVKGGSGKSTLCINIAAMLVKLNRSVCVVDADPQKSTFDWITNTKDSVLSLVNCDDVSNLDEIPQLRYEFVLIDTQGSLNKELSHFLRISSLVLVPCRVSRDDIVGQGWIQMFLERSQKGEHDTPMLAVLNGVNKRSSILSHIKQQLNDDGTDVARTTVSQRVCFSETNVNKRSVIGYNQTAESEIAELTSEILTILDNGRQ